MIDIFSTMDHEAWARDSLRAMGYEKVQPETLVAVEMVLNTKVIGSDLEHLVDVLATLRDTAKPPAPVGMCGGVGGRSVAKVFPRLPGDHRGPQGDWTVEVWLNGEEGVANGGGADKQGTPPSAARLALLLGAGNQGILSIADALYLLFVENMTCVVKHNPVRAYNHEWMCTLFSPLIRAGYFASMLGGIEEAKLLLADPRVDHVHMTGGKATHDAIVWGAGSAQREVNYLGKPITSELGAVTPYVIGPGEWSEKELDHHARYFVTVMSQNNGCNCNAPQVLVLPSENFPKAKFLGMVKAILKKRPHAPPYYPGTRPRYQAWVEGLKATATTDFIESEVKLPPGRFGPPLNWAFSEIPYEAATTGDAARIATQVEVFGPALAIVVLPKEEQSSFWQRAAHFCNDHLDGSLSCTLVPHPSQPVGDEALAAFRYGSVGINSWGGLSFGFSGGTWGAYPGETIENVASGIGVVRNFLFLNGVEKTVVRAPFISAAHIGTTPKPMDLEAARMLCAVLSNNVPTKQHNANNVYRTGNFLPIEGEGVWPTLVVEGTIPKELTGCFLRNGTNQRYAPQGKMHMFDGDAMLHAFVFAGGQCTSYANTYIRTPRFLANEAAGREEALTTFGDLTLHGLPVAKKFAFNALKQRAGAIPRLANNMAQNPATATQLIGGALYACVEVNAPFRVRVDPKTGVITSGVHDDFGGAVKVFSAHSKVDPSGNVVYFAKAERSENPRENAINCFGIIGPDGKPKTQIGFVAGEGPPPAFMHDCFVTKSYAICVDHSLRANPAKMVVSGYHDWSSKHHVRLGVFSREPAADAKPEWYDLGMPGFVWHCIAATETTAPTGDVLVTCWMPIFEQYSNEVPIHLPAEPESYLWKITINTTTKMVVQKTKFDQIGSTERCATNQAYCAEREPRFAYLMIRGQAEMYNGFVKFDLKEEKVVDTIAYGESRFGGEAFFVARPGSEEEDDGWLIDILYDKEKDGSELCLWDARKLESHTPLARIHAPHRIPYGVHANFLTPEELRNQPPL